MLKLHGSNFVYLCAILAGRGKGCWLGSRGCGWTVGLLLKREATLDRVVLATLGKCHLFFKQNLDRIKRQIHLFCNWFLQNYCFACICFVQSFYCFKRCTQAHGLYDTCYGFLNLYMGLTVHRHEVVASSEACCPETWWGGGGWGGEKKVLTQKRCVLSKCLDHPSRHLSHHGWKSCFCWHALRLKVKLFLFWWSLLSCCYFQIVSILRRSQECLLPLHHNPCL